MMVKRKQKVSENYQFSPSPQSEGKKRHQEVRNFIFQKILCAVFSCINCFEILPFTLLSMICIQL